MVGRPQILAQVRRALPRSRVVALVGPRQCGKTSLARQIVAEDSPNYFDLERPTAWRGVIVIDEVRRRPKLLPILRVLADSNRRRMLRPAVVARHLLQGLLTASS